MVAASTTTTEACGIRVEATVTIYPTSKIPVDTGTLTAIAPVITWTQKYTEQGTNQFVCDGWGQGTVGLRGER